MASAAAGLTWAPACRSHRRGTSTHNGNWGTAANWSPASVPNGVGASASLPNILTAPRTVSLNLPVTLGTLTFDGGFNYTISGRDCNTLRFDALAGNAALNVTGTAAHTISRPIVLNDTLVINQGSTGTLTLSGARSGRRRADQERHRPGHVEWSEQLHRPDSDQQRHDSVQRQRSNPGGFAVTIGDGVGAAGSAVLNLNASMSAAQALNVTLAQMAWSSRTTTGWFA